MLNDNAPALSKDNSTKDIPIQGPSIKRQIDLQESIIKDREQVIIEAEKTISAAYSDIQLAKDMLSHLKGFDINSHPDKNNAGVRPSKKQVVRDIIVETKDVNGIMNPEIKQLIAEKYGENLSSTTIDSKISELIEEGKIYQVNEGYKRGKRYLPKI